MSALDQNDCQKVMPLIDGYHDNELSSEETLLVKSHLAQCQVCADELKAVGRVVSLVKAMPPVKLSRDFTQDLDKLLSKPQPAVKLRRTGMARMYFVVGAAAAFLVLLLAIAMLSKPAQIASSTKSEPAVAVDSSRDTELLAQVAQEQEPLSEEVGIATDEDGLYAFKL